MNNHPDLPDTDLCVMCGMCLPHCPTYQLYKTEAESPRGRIALMQSIEKGKIISNNKALTHIDHCLGCLNCETICPSGVPYGKIIDQFRDKHSREIPKPFLSRQILKSATRINGVENLVRISSLPVIKQLVKLVQPLTGIPAYATTLRKNCNTQAIQNKQSSSVHLFAGCINNSVDEDTISSTKSILNLLGYDVIISDEQFCCGALHQHNGQLENASRLGQKNFIQLEKNTTEPMLFLSPACGSQLRTSGLQQLEDVRSFIYEKLRTTNTSLQALNESVLLHQSCSGRNMLKATAVNFDLLRLIPGINIVESSQPALCCGAGGLQSINYPVQAQAILDNKIKSFDFSQAKILISDNIGCTLHMTNAISQTSPDIEILHPITLIARQLVKTP